VKLNKKNNTIGFLGFGILGKLLFEKIKLFQKDILLFNRSTNKIKGKNKQYLCDNVNVLFSNSKIIFLILYDDNSIKSVFSKISKENLKNKILVNLTTNSYKFSHKYFFYFKKRETIWIDAPILGSVEALKKNKLTFLYSGKRIKKISNILNTIGKIIYYKKPGISQLIKLSHNAVCGQLLISIGEILKIARNHSIHEKIIFDMFKYSAFYSPLIRNKIPKYLKNKYEVSFSYYNLIKDLKLFNKLSKNRNMTLNSTYKIFKKFYKPNFSKYDCSIITKAIKNS